LNGSCAFDASSLSCRLKVSGGIPSGGYLGKGFPMTSTKNRRVEFTLIGDKKCTRIDVDLIRIRKNYFSTYISTTGTRIPEIL